MCTEYEDRGCLLACLQANMEVNSAGCEIYYKSESQMFYEGRNVFSVFVTKTSRIHTQCIFGKERRNSGSK